MRIRRFDLRAYGHFTNLSLDLAPGLNILYGDNEAGKSTALRALGQLLFGFTPQCSDDFLHPYKALRLGGLFEEPEGRQFVCIRRKSNIDSLRGEDDVAVLPVDTLDKLLGGIERGRFDSQFGINYEQLVAGGREICSGKGDLGEILFAAASGVSHLGRMLRQLEDETADLFNPRGNATKASINKALSDRNKKLQEIKNLQLLSSVWEEHVQALEHDREKLRNVQAELRRIEGERERMQRLRQAVPLIARRQLLLAEHERLAEAPLLAEGFDERRFKLQSDQITAQTRRDELDEALAGLGRKVDEFAIPEELLQRASQIQQLNQELGSYLKAQRDRHRLEGQLKLLDSGIQSRLRELGRDVDDNKVSGVSRQQRARIQKLAKEGLGFVKDVQIRDERRREIEREIDHLSTDLERQEVVAVADELRAVVANVQSQGNLDSQLVQRRTALENARKQANLDLSGLGLWKGPLEKLEELPVPALETVDRFDADFSGLQGQIALAERQLRESRQQLDELGQRLARFRSEHDVPTEADLREARSLRDDGWKLVREGLSSGGLGAGAARGAAYDEACQRFRSRFPGAESLTQAFEQSIVAADAVADRLRRDADLVAQKAQLLSDQGRQQEIHDGLQGDLAGLASRANDVDEKWKALWRPAEVDPLSPREMRAWISRRTQLVDRARGVLEQAADVQRLSAEIARHAARLRHFLEPQGLDLDDDVALAELTALAIDCVKRADDAARTRSQREDSLRQRNAELADAKELAQAAIDSVAAWRGQWTSSMQVLSLSGEASIEEATAVLESFDEIIAQQGKACDLADRIEGIDAEAAEFQSALAGILDDIAPDLRVLAVEPSLAQLVKRLDAAQEARTRREELIAQREEREALLVDAAETLQRCQAGLAVLCREAACFSPDDLPVAERASRERQRVEKELADVNGRLGELAAGRDVDELDRQARECEPDQFGSRIAELDSELSGLSQQRDGLLTATGGKETALALMDGSGKAADAQAEVEALLAQIRADAERYVRLKLATGVLRETMEQFRQKNQGPILELASRIFSRLTLGSFCSLRVELNDSGAPALLGVRNGAETVPLEGMSEGTSDQLFLALRIASLENYFRDHPPIPFVVDDILIKFDDDRAVAALETLHELSRHTQVVMFTHHRHLLDLATQRLPEGACSISSVALPAAP